MTFILGAFSLFTLVRFPNDECRTDSTGIRGICRSTGDCDSVGGTADGECASGFGVCCYKV